MVDVALAGLRDRDALAALPESEREECGAFWSDVEALRGEALRERADRRIWAGAAM
jgi:hypothetical protein